MTAAERLADALDLLATVKAAYKKAVQGDQYVQTGQRRNATHDIDKLRADVGYWQKEADRLEGLVNGTPRPGITAPLRPNL